VDAPPPQSTHNVLKCELLEVLFVQLLRFIKVFYLVAVPIIIKHSNAWWCSDMERVVWDFVRTKDLLVDMKMEKHPAR
jgi:hypothetical protein